MSLVVLTGGARAGKSAVAQRMALAHEGPVVVAVAGAPDDGEMRRRIEKHQEERPASFATLEIADPEDWLQAVPSGSLLVLDCLTTLVGRIVGRVWDECGGAEADRLGEITHRIEEEAQLRVDTLVLGLTQRRGETIIVTNEVGEGVVPATPSGRLFRDLLGAANKRLVSRADGAWLVVAGKCLDLNVLPATPRWPSGGDRKKRA